MPEPQDNNQTQVNQDIPPEPTDAELHANAVAAAEAVEAQQITPPPTEEKPQESGLDTKKLALQVARLEKQLRDQKAGYDKAQQEKEELVAALKDPEKRYALIEEHGGTYQDWTNQIVSGSKPQKDPRDLELDQIRQTLSQMQSQLEQRNKVEQEQTQNQALGEARQYAAKYLEDNKDKYPYLHATRHYDELINEAVRRNNEGLPVDDGEIAAEVEAKLVEIIKGNLTSLSKLDSFSAMLSEFGYQRVAQSAQEKELTQRESVRGQTNQTLTNDLSGQPSSGFDYFSATDDELTQRAKKIAEQAAAEAQRNA